MHDNELNHQLGVIKKVLRSLQGRRRTPKVIVVNKQPPLGNWHADVSVKGRNKAAFSRGNDIFI